MRTHASNVLPGVIRTITLALLAFLSASVARADWTVSFCLKNPPSKEDQLTARVTSITDQVAEAIGLGATGVFVRPCDMADKAYSYVTSSGDGIAPGRYIVFNPTWVQEVIGNDQVQLVALFGHELGHILNDHFGARRDLPLPQKEAEADHFAGCAVASLGGAWESLEDLLTRLRKEKSTLYPDRLTSVNTAHEGFLRCQKRGVNKTVSNSECASGGICLLQSGQPSIGTVTQKSEGSKSPNVGINSGSIVIH